MPPPMPPMGSMSMPMVPIGMPKAPMSMPMAPPMAMMSELGAIPQSLPQPKP